MKSPLAELIAFTAVGLAALGLVQAFIAFLLLAALLEFVAHRPPTDAGSR